MTDSSDRTNRLFQDVPWHQVLGADLLGLDSVELGQLQSSLARHSRRSIRLRQVASGQLLPFQVEPVPWYSRGRWLLDDSIRPGAFLHHAAGDYYIQDAGSMLALNLCRPMPHQIVCDLCAAPGGKATGLLEQLAHTGFLLANEAIQSRIPVLHSALCRTGFGNFATTCLDASRLVELVPGQFDCVLVDAPCSGQSMVARDKQSMAAFSDRQIQHSAARQRRILEAASSLVKPGGKLVYSTCTFSVAENELVLENFLGQHASWQLVEYPELKPWASPRLPGSYRLWPHRDRCDGAFAAALVLAVDDQASHANPQPDANHATDSSNKRHSFKHSTGPSRWQPWRCKLNQLECYNFPGDQIQDYTLWQRGDSIHLLHRLIPQEVIPQVQTCLTLARQLSGRFEPEYSAAVATQPHLQPALAVELNSLQARQYLSGDCVPLADPLSQGWCRTAWAGRPLGWGKIAGNQLKNHLPKGLRQNNLMAE